MASLASTAFSSEARLYTFSDETKTKLRKFRLGTSRANDPQAVICTPKSTFSHAYDYLCGTAPAERAIPYNGADA
ncbi:hypothetical protein A1F94_011425 [Pyrenophora tritici-repentis]|nr:hypothetical protein A1F94_011425 [Pyrenophora tritici-repentis]